ncbi:MAG: GntR family transcriptional regulator [Thalassobaculales bacterium]
MSQPASPRKTAQPTRLRLAAVAPRTRVDQVVEAIIAGAAEGLFLPGDRLVEAEIARALDISRVPVREALRILESQGIVINSPYKGMRLMTVDRERLHDVLSVRVALEKLAVQEALARPGGLALAPLAAMVEEMERMARIGDHYGIATCDTDMHRALCRMSGNAVLLSMWETLSRQLTVIFGLSSLEKRLETIVDEHRRLLEVLAGGDPAAIDREIETHIMDQLGEVDLAAIAERRRTG